MKKINNFDSLCQKINLPIILIRKIERSLKNSGGKIFLVGGSVRDLIQKKKITQNPDLVVNLNFTDLISCLNKSRIKFLDIGSKFGSVVVSMEKKKFDLTSTRSDIDPDGRWTKIKFTNNLVEDSKRRDFTINSIYCDTDGNIYDPNKGVKDLINRRIKFIGNINDRINEDHLRILRFFRFSLSISGFFEKKILRICKNNLHKLKKLSYERRIQELKKIILNPKIEKIEILNDLKDLIENTLESKINLNNFSRLCKLEFELKDESFERRLKFFFRSKKIIPEFIFNNSDNRLKKRLEKNEIIKSYSENEFNLKLYKYNKIYLIDQLLIDHADNLISKNKFNDFIKKTNNFKKKKFPLNGDDLMKIGFKPGKVLGNVLEKVELWWIENKFRNNKNQCIEFARNFLP